MISTFDRWMGDGCILGARLGLVMGRLAVTIDLSSCAVLMQSSSGEDVYKLLSNLSERTRNYLYLVKRLRS